ncbi:hypothetical protein CYMTET_44687 [Cymbomonas tetramitiformis]|uniref:Uncharacterized protein n=1 Tax=Cymbomonas tetramitiformis TaxID=36881 RepID=A0AAE0EX78_9CHLO|nr:hypothetical protein CYMTET_46276 [Cymbomonas tetramitiformis]KAK3245866.1 hypothetical protein CYMTET_44687 [Cymbomonas tetramitiformis]
MSRNFTGCIYSNPPLNKKEASFTDLTKDELKNMNLVGLPIKVEHDGPCRGVITNQNTNDESGYTTITFNIDEGYAGDALINLIKYGGLPDLSLCHNIYGDSDMPFELWEKEPVEIVKMSAGVVTSEAQKSLVADGINASHTIGQPKAVEQTGGVDTTNSRDGRARKVSFETASNEAPPPQESPQNNTHSGASADDLINIADVVEDLAKEIPEDKRKGLAEVFEKMTKMQMDIYKQLNTATSTNQELKSMYEDLQKDNKRMVEEREAQYGDMASQITDAISDIYMQYNGAPMDDQSKKQFNEHLCGNGELVKTLRGLPAATVAMSAQRQLLNVGNQLRDATKSHSEANESALTTKLREYQKELSSLRSAGASQQVILNQDHASNALANPNRMMSVSASESKYKEAYSLLPSALKDGLKSYDTSCGVGRIVPDDFSGDLVGSKRQRIV